MGEYTDRPDERKRLADSLREGLRASEREKGAKKVEDKVKEYKRRKTPTSIEERLDRLEMRVRALEGRNLRYG